MRLIGVTDFAVTHGGECEAKTEGTCQLLLDALKATALESWGNGIQAGERKGTRRVAIRRRVNQAK